MSGGGERALCEPGEYRALLFPPPRPLCSLAALSIAHCPVRVCVCVCQGHVDVLKSPCLSFLFHCRQAAGWGDGE